MVRLDVIPEAAGKDAVEIITGWLKAHYEDVVVAPADAEDVLTPSGHLALYLSFTMRAHKAFRVEMQMTVVRYPLDRPAFDESITRNARHLLLRYMPAVGAA